VRGRISREKVLILSREIRGASKGGRSVGKDVPKHMLTIDTCRLNAGLRHSCGAQSPS
jgi:hypothetical protein